MELFPASLLANSILTSVLIGVLITWAFQESFGWNFSGLVVPGYLASIFIIEPLTGLMVTVEAVFTYVLVYCWSELTPTHWPNSRLFGRDRFLALLLASVTLRLLVEGALLPMWAEQSHTAVHPALHSMGLLVMPLGANALWRTGMARGLIRLGTPVALTYLALAVIGPLTNLSMSSFELNYEDLALDFTHSPKAYMLLLMGAWLASVTNREYGFDYGGIIVPGLLAVCWMWPVRVATTFGEAFLVWALMSALVRLPRIKDSNLAGGRPLVMAFVSIYIVKFVLGWVAGWTWPGARIHELFGFGYLLPTLMGLRMYKHGEPFQFAVPALACSLVAFAATHGLGFAMQTWLPTPEAERSPPDTTLVAYADHPGGRYVLERGGRGPVLSAKLGTAGLALATLELAEALDSRAVHLCAATVERCAPVDRGWSIVAGTQTTLHVPEGSRTRVPRLPPGYDIAIAAGPNADHPVLSLDAHVLTRNAPETPSTLPSLRATDAEARPTQAELRVWRYEVGGALAHFAAGGSDALLRKLAPLVSGTAHAEGGSAALNAHAVSAHVRRDGRPLIVLVPDAHAPGLASLSFALAKHLDARAWIAQAAPPHHSQDGAGRDVATAITTALVDAWPDAVVVEIQGLRDVYDLDAAWGYSPDTAPAPLLDAMRDFLGAAPLAYDHQLRAQPLRGFDTPLQQSLPPGKHLKVMIDTRLRRHFVAPNPPNVPKQQAWLGPRPGEIRLPPITETQPVTDREAPVALLCLDQTRCPWTLHSLKGPAQVAPRFLLPAQEAP